MQPKSRRSYDKHPFIAIGPAEDCTVDWADVVRVITSRHTSGVLCIECYPGVSLDELEHALRLHCKLGAIIRADHAYKSATDIKMMLRPALGDDRVFGRMNGVEIVDYFDPDLLAKQQKEARQAENLIIVIGTGASLIAPAAETLVYADLARWEIQLRWRMKNLPNLGLDNHAEGIAPKYKCGYFVEWRAADRLKKQLLPHTDFLLDTNVANFPKLIRGGDFRRALSIAAHRPFRVVPYFDPGPWGGHWMEEVCDLPRDAPNHA